MHDIRAIRANAAAFDAALARRGLPSASAEILHATPNARRADLAAGQAGTPQRDVA